MFVPSDQCRICLDEENADQLISICKCKGSLEFVHLTCLAFWIETKNTQKPSTFSDKLLKFTCELCNTDIHYKKKFELSALEATMKLVKHLVFSRNNLILFILNLSLTFAIVTKLYYCCLLFCCLLSDPCFKFEQANIITLSGWGWGPVVLKNIWKKYQEMFQSLRKLKIYFDCN